mmetsp:Transcript_21243/g.45127  ORF Transcript_21243/g.45127 Transcript_21243/m.45127 type:complete len:404 (-) Transcript_21243:226-1437(-)
MGQQVSCMRDRYYVAMDEPPLDQESSAPPTVPSVLPSGYLTSLEKNVDQRIRTLCLVICASAVIAAAAYYLKGILIPFVLALALSYLLTPIIDILSCAHCKCKYSMPRAIATIIAFAIALGTLFVIGIIVGDSIARFTANAGMYRARMEHLLNMAYNATRDIQQELGMSNGGGHTAADMDVASLDAIKEFMRRLSVTDIILTFLGSAAHMTEDVIYILLFLVFMLLSHSPHGAHGTTPKTGFHAHADEQIYTYIRGKVLISTWVALVHSSILYLVGQELWLVFGLLAFWLNFIPNIGMFTAVCLPMPIIVLDPKYSSIEIAVAFFGPLISGVVSKDVLEPIVIGGGAGLHPVIVLLAIMLWGSVWGLTGMVLAVPMTAVCRIYLANTNHPLTRWMASVLSGSR